MNDLLSDLAADFWPALRDLACAGMIVVLAFGLASLDMVARP